MTHFVVLAAAGVIILMPVSGHCQADCGDPVSYPAGATCDGGVNHGKPCYTFVGSDNYGCPGGTCVESPGGGRATYYDVTAVNACSITLGDPATALVTAVAEFLWDGSSMCGRCARVTGPLGTVVVQITDLCPVLGNEQWCGGDAAHLDLSETAFAAIADPVRGVTYVDWEIVPCPVSGNATVETSSGVNQWWMALIARDTLHGVSSMAIKESAGSDWIVGARDNWNRFIFQSGTGWTFPLSLRLTDIADSQITATDLVTDATPETSYDMGDQFPSCPFFADGFESGNTSAWGS